MQNLNYDKSTKIITKNVVSFKIVIFINDINFNL
jgi:hypothetical protein